MNDTHQKVRIKLSDVGNREEEVLKILSKIQGLTDTPERLVANVPCHISKEVPLPLAEKVKKYLEKVGAIIELEESGVSGLRPPASPLSEIPSMFHAPGNEVADTEEDITIFQSETPGYVPVVKTPPPDQSFPEDVEVFEATPQKRSRLKKRPHPRNFSGIALGIAFVVLIVGGIWMYLSGQFSNLSSRYKRNPLVGQVGILEIENDIEAKLGLHHIIGTRVIEQLPLEGRKIRLERGDYYLEARKGDQVLHFPVYIEGRGHRVRINVSFPNTPAPIENTVYIPPGWFRMGNKEINIAHFGFPDEKPR